jgi:hypothetical protein
LSCLNFHSIHQACSFEFWLVPVQNVEVLHNAGVMQILRPLLLDGVPNIQQTASLALSRLASYSEEIAEAIVHENILIQLVYSLK